MSKLPSRGIHNDELTVDVPSGRHWPVNERGPANRVVDDDGAVEGVVRRRMYEKESVVEMFRSVNTSGSTHGLHLVSLVVTEEDEHSPLLEIPLENLAHSHSDQRGTFLRAPFAPP